MFDIRQASVLGTATAIMVCVRGLNDDDVGIEDMLAWLELRVKERWNEYTKDPYPEYDAAVKTVALLALRIGKEYLSDNSHLSKRG